MTLRPDDQQYVPAISAALPLVIVADPDATAYIGDIYGVARDAALAAGLDSFPTGAMRRVIHTLGIPMERDRADWFVVGYRLRDASAAVTMLNNLVRKYKRARR